MGNITQVLLILVTVLSGSSAFAVEMRYNEVCSLLKARQNGLATDSDDYRLLQEDLVTHCSITNEADWFKPFEGKVNPVLQKAPETLRTASQTQAEAERMIDEDQSAIRASDNCKHFCAEVTASCRSSIAVAESRYQSDYNRIAGLFNGNQASISQACNSVGSFESTANNAISSAVNGCSNQKQQCANICEKSKSLASQTAGPSATGGAPLPPRNASATTWIEENHRAGDIFIANIQQYVHEAQQKAQANAQALSQQCQQARNKQTEQTETKQAEKKKDESSGGPSLQQIGQGLQALGQMLGQDQTVPALPFQPINNPMPIMPNFQETSSPSQMYGVPRDKGAPGSVNSNNQGVNLGGYDEPIAPRDRSQTGLAGGQGGGGGGAGVSSGGGSAPNAANKARGGGGRARLDSEVYKGFQGGAAGSPSGFRGGDGYPTVQMGPPGSVPRGGNLPTVNAKGVTLQKFLPSTWSVRRQVANTTGPDGITGPHTNLFNKIRVRYAETLLGTDF